MKGELDEMQQNKSLSSLLFSHHPVPKDHGDMGKCILPPVGWTSAGWVL